MWHAYASSLIRNWNTFRCLSLPARHAVFQLNCFQILSCQPRVTVTSCFVYNVIRDLWSIDHLFINPIRRIGLIHKWSIDSRWLKWSVYVSDLLNNCKQSITSLSLLVGTKVLASVCLFLWHLIRALIGALLKFKFSKKTYLIVIKDETGLKFKINDSTLFLIGSYARKLVASY